MPAKKKKMPNRKRSLSYKQNSKQNKKITKEAPAAASDTAPADPNRLDARVSKAVQSRSATSYVTNAALKSNLKRTISKLSATTNTVVDQEKKLSAMSKKTKDLTENVRKGREAVKEVRSLAAAASRDANIKIKKVESNAAASVAGLEDQLKKMHGELKKMQDIIDDKDSQISKQKHDYEQDLERAVSLAVEKEKVCLQNICFLLHLENQISLLVRTESLK